MNSGKLRLDLIPVSTHYAIARAAGYGLTKYPERNWEKGLPLSCFYSSALRHLHAWFSGENTDAESNGRHLDFALWNLSALVETDQRVAEGSLPEALDDRPIYDIMEVKAT